MLKFSFPFPLPPLSLSSMFHLVLPSPSSRRGPPPPLQPSQANVEPRPPHSSQICSSHPGNPQNSIATPRAARGTRSGAHPPPLHRNSRGGDASCGPALALAPSLVIGAAGEAELGRIALSGGGSLGFWPCRPRRRAGVPACVAGACGDLGASEP
jgi:hypothetical protein